MLHACSHLGRGSSQIGDRLDLISWHAHSVEVGDSQRIQRSRHAHRRGELKVLDGLFGVLWLAVTRQKHVPEVEDGVWITHRSTLLKVLCGRGHVLFDAVICGQRVVTAGTHLCAERKRGQTWRGGGTEAGGRVWWFDALANCS